MNEATKLILTLVNNALQQPPQSDIQLSPDDFDMDNEEQTIAASAHSEVFQAASIRQDTEDREHVGKEKEWKWAVKALRLSFLLSSNPKDTKHEKRTEIVAKKIIREITIWRSLVKELHHTNILPLHGVFLGKKTVYFVSEYMKNGTVSDYLHGDDPQFKRGGEETLKIVKGIAEGLNHMHRNSIFHGDLKSSNILVSERGTALLADFGVSKVVGNSKVTQSLGTINFVAPELFRSSSAAGRDWKAKHTEESDMWSFAMVIYELLGDSDSFRELLAAEKPLEKPARDPRSHWHMGRYFEHLWRICLPETEPSSRNRYACRCKAPKDRATAEEIVEYLKKVVEDHILCYEDILSSIHKPSEMNASNKSGQTNLKRKASELEEGRNTPARKKLRSGNQLEA